jgi:hypothetical protein
VTPRVDRDQLAALRRLQGAFGTVQVLAVHRNQVEGAPAGPSLAPQQLALTIPTRPAPQCRRHDPEIGWERLPDPPSTERGS